MKENPLVKAPAEIRVSICSKCRAHFVDNRWREPSSFESALEDAARAAVLSELRFAQFTPAGTRLLSPHEIKGVELRVEPKLAAGEVAVDVHARGKVHELQVSPHDEHVRIVVKPMWRTGFLLQRRSLPSDHSLAPGR
jgi:NMD protein affecting ribosome stability and mRNA decay